MANQAEGTEQLYVEVPPSLKYLVDEDDRTNKEVVISALETELGVTETESEAVIRRKIKRKEQRFEARRDELQETKTEVSDLKVQIDRLRGILESKEEVREQYRDALDELLEKLVSGEINSVFPEHGKVATIAAEFDTTPAEVIWDLKERAVDQDLALTNAHFMDTYQTSNDFSVQPIEETFPGGDHDE